MKQKVYIMMHIDSDKTTGKVGPAFQWVQLENGQAHKDK